MASANGVGQLEGIADRTPDRLGLDSGRNGPVDGQPKSGKLEVGGHAAGVRGAELGRHPLPELSETHLFTLGTMQLSVPTGTLE
jgi:hypothetical protein